MQHPIPPAPIGNAPSQTIHGNAGALTDSLRRAYGGYCSCGELWDHDCQGNRRCPVCDPPCPCCDDGGLIAQEQGAQEESAILRRSKRLASMVESYLETALSATTDGESGTPFDDLYTTDDFAPEALSEAVSDCAAFLADHSEDIGDDTARAGHDFWLTRNHHGVGFWDGDWPSAAGKRLTDAAHVYGSVDCYIGDDGRICFA